MAVGLLWMLLLQIENKNKGEYDFFYTRSDQITSSLRTKGARTRKLTANSAWKDGSKMKKRAHRKSIRGKKSRAQLAVSTIESRLKKLLTTNDVSEVNREGKESMLLSATANTQRSTTTNTNKERKIEREWALRLAMIVMPRSCQR